MNVTDNDGPGDGCVPPMDVARGVEDATQPLPGFGPSADGDVLHRLKRRGMVAANTINSLLSEIVGEELRGLVPLVLREVAMDYVQARHQRRSIGKGRDGGGSGMQSLPGVGRVPGAHATSSDLGRRGAPLLDTLDEREAALERLQDDVLKEQCHDIVKIAIHDIAMDIVRHNRAVRIFDNVVLHALLHKDLTRAVAREALAEQVVHSLCNDLCLEVGLEVLNFMITDDATGAPMEFPEDVVARGLVEDDLGAGLLTTAMLQLCAGIYVGGARDFAMRDELSLLCNRLMAEVCLHRSMSLAQTRAEADHTLPVGRLHKKLTSELAMHALAEMLAEEPLDPTAEPARAVQFHPHLATVEAQSHPASLRRGASPVDSRSDDQSATASSRSSELASASSTTDTYSSASSFLTTTEDSAD